MENKQTRREMMQRYLAEDVKPINENAYRRLARRYKKARSTPAAQVEREELINWLLEQG